MSRPELERTARFAKQTGLDALEAIDNKKKNKEMFDRANYLIKMEKET
jgi:hypothetical protein